MSKHKNTIKKVSIYNEYRRVLEMPKLTDKEIEEMRDNLKLIATTICEHVWKKKFY